jgi:antitoxin (DNA-binding transcriptional repressor) of toxin-antitoxin stability system
MLKVPMHQAKTRLTELVAAVERGERVVITRHGKPAAELTLPRKGGLDWAALEAYRQERGLANVTGPTPEELEAALAPMDEDELFGPEWAAKFDDLRDPRA